MTKPHILVIGGGILGAITAGQLARASAKVTLIDPMEDERRTSVGSLAWLNASSTADPDYARLRLASMHLWHRLAESHRDCPVWFPGALHLGGNPDSVRAHSALMDSLGWPVEVIGAAELAKRIPELAHPPEVALLASQEGAAHPDRITAWMHRRARLAGVNAVQGRVRGLRTQGGAVSGVELRGGDRIAGDWIVVTAGNGSRALLADVGVDLPVSRSPGILMRTSPAKFSLPYVMATPKLDFWQESTGEILMSSSLAKTPDRADDLMAKDALAALSDLLPDLPTVKVTRAIRRDRPIPDDGFPLVGAADPKGLWVAVTHSGMTLAPIIAEALEDQILGQAERHDLVAYQPDRPIGVKQERAAL